MRNLGMIVQCVALGLLSFAAGYLVKQYLAERSLKSARAKAEKLLAEAETKYKEMILGAKDEALKIRDEAEAEIKNRNRELQRQERRLQKRRESLDRRFDALENRVRKCEAREKKLDRAEQELEHLRQRRISELERISAMSQEEAKELFLEAVAEESRQDAARVIREIEFQAKEGADQRAQEIITTAIQRFASDYVADVTVSTVPLPNEEMKGRIIGRQGRNIRAFEQATGVDVVVDDTPDAVTISCYDPVRREIARQALTKLILDGRIHPARIEKVVEKAQEEVGATIREEGERAVYEVGVHGLHPDLIKLIGQMKYRTSYGQNVLAHSIETAHLAAMMAADLGANVEVVKVGALLHDIGKVVSHEVNGPHALIGAEIAQRYGVAPEVVEAIASHHHEQEPQSVEAILVEAADAISGARPGARRETLELYLKRIKALENVANSFPGVAESYAIQAGREIRILVKPGEIDDLGVIQLSRGIAKKVEETLEYPGQVKVTVIRETRAVDYAK
jgi:ribonuclease Y